MSDPKSRSEAYHEGYKDGLREGQRLTLSERNRLARLAADANDERDDMLKQLAALQDHVAIIDDDRRVLCDELEKATGRDWTAEQARSWSQ